MNYGLQISASGLLTSLYRQDVFSNNLANINTVGFKPDVAATRQRDVARVEDGLGLLPSNRLLERLGAGVMPAASRVSMRQGTLQTTGNPLDLAIDGDGFFVVRTRTEGREELRLTRDGRFMRDAQGRLVTAAEGLPVMDEENDPIHIPDDAPITIAPDGTISSGGARVARLRIAGVDDPARLTKLGHSLFAAPEGAIVEPGPGRVKQHAVETAAVDPIEAMMAVAAASRDAESNAGLIGQHDRLMERAINGLGRVA